MENPNFRAERITLGAGGIVDQYGTEIATLGSLSRRGLLPGTLIADVTFGGAGSTTETVLGTVQVPAGVLRAGSILRPTAFGIVASSNSTDTLRCRLRYGGLAGALLADSTAVDIADNDIFLFKGIATCSVVSPTAGVIRPLILPSLGDTSASPSAEVTAQDTEGATTIVLTGQMSTTNVGNSFVLSHFFMELLG